MKFYLELAEMNVEPIPYLPMDRDGIMGGDFLRYINEQTRYHGWTRSTINQYLYALRKLMRAAQCPPENIKRADLITYLNRPQNISRARDFRAVWSLLFDFYALRGVHLAEKFIFSQRGGVKKVL